MKSELDLIKFQYYAGDIRKPVPLGTITLNKFISVHKNPTNAVLEVFDDIERAELDGRKDAKSKLKRENLYYFTPGAIFNGRRRYVNITGFTGLAQIDIDGLEHEEALDLKHWLFDNYKEMYCAYISPSRTGVKALIRIPIVKNVKEFKEYYAGIEEEFEWIAGFDSAPKNLALPLFLSYDVDILWRDEATVWNKKGEVQPDEMPNLSNTPPPKPLESGGEDVYRSQAYFRKITLDLYAKKLDAINDNGHPQARGAALVLGSRVGAGYLTQSDAESYAEWCIRNNTYLAKGVEGYIDTMRWGIKQGIKSPKYYD